MAEKLIVAILIDALGWEVVKEFGFCKDILPHGDGMETVLGYSSAAIPSIMTGELPADHGSWAMYSYDPANSPFRMLRFIPWVPARLESRVRRMLKQFVDARGLIKGYYDLYEIPLKYLKLFDIPQRWDPYSPTQRSAGTILSELHEKSVPFKVWEYRTDEKDNFKSLLDSIHSNNVFLFLYTPELDSLMHREGIFGAGVRSKLKEYETLIMKIMEKAGAIGKEIDLYVFSDHGMTDVRGVVDVWGKVDQSGLEMGDDFIAFYDATMARFWADGIAASKLKELLSNIDSGRILDEQELMSLGCNFADGRYGKIIFLVKPGMMISPNFMGKDPLAAMHGYHPDDKYSKACFLTNDLQCKLPGSILELKEFLIGKILGIS